MDHRDRSLILAVIGVVLLLVGLAAAFLGPVEMYCFYLFSENGRLHYDGFGFGSFMFGNIACQIVGYYVIAILCIPLGYGHLRVRRWTRTVSLTLLWFWRVVGLPLVILFFLVLVTAKDLSLAAVLMVVVALALSYLAMPGLLIRFYQSRDTRLTFETKDPEFHWMERLPRPILVLCSLYLFYAVVLHVPILFNGIFPLFGGFLFGLQGIVLLDVSIAFLVYLTWGTFKSRPWAWWGALIFFGLMTFSSILTFLKSSYADILSGMKFPPTEMRFLEGVPLQGFHLAAFFGVPLLATLGAIIVSKRHFKTGNPALSH